MHIFVNAGIVPEIAFYILIRLAAADSDIFGERERADAVYYAEIDRFRAASHYRSDKLRRHIKDLGRGHSVDIRVVVERLYHVSVSRNMGENAQLNLRIVRVNEHISVPRDEEFPHLAPERRAHGDILKIRLGR